VSEEYIHNEPLQNLRKRISYLKDIKGYSQNAIAEAIKVDRGNFNRASQENSVSRRGTLIKYSKLIDEKFEDELKEFNSPVKIPDAPEAQDDNKATEPDFQFLTGPVKKLTGALEIYISQQRRQQAMMELLLQLVGPLAGKTEEEIEKMLTDKIKSIENG
jgi:hypothetical protein